MTEQDIMKGNVKLTVFDTFPMEEMIKINNAFENLGYKGLIVNNGNIVFQKQNH